MKKTHFIFLTLFLLFSFNIKADVELKEISLCHEDNEVFPWLLNNQNGLIHKQMQIIEKEAKVKFKLISIPWKRCQLLVKMGEIDGVLSASPTPSRLETYEYPKNKKGELDRDFRMHEDQFIVYKNKNSDIDYKNGKFINLGNAAVAVELGYSVQEKLTAMGITVYTSFNSLNDLLNVLSNGTLKAAVLQDYTTRYALENSAKKFPNVVTIPEPFVKVDQYIAFNRIFANSHRSLVDNIWTGCKKSRSAPEYVNLKEQLMKQIRGH